MSIDKRTVALKRFFGNSVLPFCDENMATLLSL